MSPSRRNRIHDVIVCDIDGCLCSEDGSALDLDALARIRRFNKQARDLRDRPALTLCSGRPIGFVEAMTRLIGNSTLPAVAEMGAYLYFPDTTRSELDPAITPACLAGVAGLTAYFEQELRPRGVTMQPGKSASVTLWHERTALLRDEIMPLVVERCEAEGWPFRVSMSWFYINCDLAHISKASGIERFKAHSGISGDRLVGIGDTSSDLAIREQVAYFCCPANAIDEVKAVADFVASRPEAEGVIEILEHLMSV
ncbi:MAG TPA: hypothetical protein ENJ00_02485 [Phycisphaerales bacterium]|nr:hypothetical protein [Phycisphaerales bacterium]